MPIRAMKKTTTFQIPARINVEACDFAKFLNKYWRENNLMPNTAVFSASGNRVAFSFRSEGEMVDTLYFNFAEGHIEAVAQALVQAQPDLKA